MAVKKTEKGKVLCDYGIFKIRQIPTWKDAGNGKKIMTSSTIGIFHSKHKVKDGFKNKEAAMLFIDEKQGSYNKATHKFR